MRREPRDEPKTPGKIPGDSLLPSRTAILPFWTAGVVLLEMGFLPEASGVF